MKIPPSFLVSGDSDTDGIDVYIFYAGGVKDAGADLHGRAGRVNVVDQENGGYTCKLLLTCRIDSKGIQKII